MRENEDEMIMRRHAIYRLLIIPFDGRTKKTDKSF